MQQRRVGVLFLILLGSLAAIGSIGVGRSARTALASTTSPLYFDLAIDEPRQRLYGSDRAGGKLDVISLQTRQVVSSINLGIGSQPGGLDLSADGAQLAVALSGNASIALINPSTLSVTASLEPQGVAFGPNVPYDVIFGQIGRLYSVGNTGGLDYVHAYDTLAKQEIGRSEAVMRAQPRLAISSDHTRLYVGESDSSPQIITSFSVITTTPTLAHVNMSNPTSPNLRTLAVAPDGASVYTSMGQKWPADLTGTSSDFVIFGGSEIEYITATDQIVLSNNIAEGAIPNQIAVVDASGGRFALSSLHTITGVSAIGVTRANAAGTLLYMSTDRGIQLFVLKRQLWIPQLTDGLLDDFSNPDSGWPAGEDTIIKYGYLDGQYRVLFKKTGYLVRLGRGLSWGDLDMSVDVSQFVGGAGGGVTTGSYGMFFGSGPAGFYFFELAGQTFGLYRYDSAAKAYVKLAGDSATLNSAWPRMRVVRRGAQITLFIESQQVAQVQDSTLGAGFLGLMASADSPMQSIPFEARFDRFVLTTPRMVTNSSGAAARATQEDLQPIRRP